LRLLREDCHASLKLWSAGLFDTLPLIAAAPQCKLAISFISSAFTISEIGRLCRTMADAGGLRKSSFMPLGEFGGLGSSKVGAGVPSDYSFQLIRSSLFLKPRSCFFVPR